MPFAHKIFVSSLDLEGIKKNMKDKKIEIGNIVREEIVNFNASSTFKKRKVSILIMGGSQAAKSFAEILPRSI